MAPTATTSIPPTARRRPMSPVKRAWNEERTEIPSILVGSGQENASTARHNLEEGMDPERRKSSEQLRSRSRANSLRHVKNSTEVLRQRSMKKGRKENEMERTPSTKEGRHFTVANVGTNGKIYLRLADRGLRPICFPPIIMVLMVLRG